MNESYNDRFEVVTEHTSLSCGTTVPVTSRTVSVQAYPGKRSGSQNPKWRDQVSRGINATTGYSRSGYVVNANTPTTYDFEAKCSSGQVNKGSQFRRGTVGHLPGVTDFFGIPVPNAASAQNQAIMGFIHDAKAQYNSISGMTFLGELRETLSMIRNPAKNLRALVKRYLDTANGRRSSFRTRRDAERWLSGLWLEYAFGWVPLISDTKAGAEALARLIHGDIRYSTARGAGFHDTAVPPIRTNFNVPGLPTVGTRETVRTAHQSCFIKGGVNAKASGPTLENAAHLFGFTPEEFVPTVWNLLPWSFLVDYFANVGDVLEATFFDRTGITWSSMTTRTEYVYMSHVQPKSISGWSGSVTGGSTKVTKKSMSRSVTAPLIPSLEVSLPGSPQKWINMAALLDQHKRMVPYVR
jgi:hypothetical protein